MRRVMMLALLALSSPTGALANAIHFDTGIVNGPNGCCVVAGPTITIALTNIQYGMWFDEITGGTLTVTNTSTGATLFQSSVASGLVDASIVDRTVEGTLEPSATVKSSVFAFVFGTGGALADASFASVDAVSVPEPSALGGILLGTGLLGLVEMARRKLKLGT